MKTIFVNEKDQKREWFIIDASGKSLGRVASAAAKALRGKTKVTFTPNQNMGDYIVIINAEKVNVTGGKEQKKEQGLYKVGAYNRDRSCASVRRRNEHFGKADTLFDI